MRQSLHDARINVMLHCYVAPYLKTFTEFNEQSHCRLVETRYKCNKGSDYITELWRNYGICTYPNFSEDVRKRLLQLPGIVGLLWYPDFRDRKFGYRIIVGSDGGDPFAKSLSIIDAEEVQTTERMVSYEELFNRSEMIKSFIWEYALYGLITKEDIETSIDEWLYGRLRTSKSLPSLMNCIISCRRYL